MSEERVIDPLPDNFESDVEWLQPEEAENRERVVELVDHLPLPQIERVGQAVVADQTVEAGDVVVACYGNETNISIVLDVDTNSVRSMSLGFGQTHGRVLNYQPRDISQDLEEYRETDEPFGRVLHKHIVPEEVTDN